MYDYIACMYVNAPVLYNALRDQKRASDLLELQLKTVVRHHVVLGIEPGSSARAARAINH